MVKCSCDLVQSWMVYLDIKDEHFRFFQAQILLTLYFNKLALPPTGISPNWYFPNWPSLGLKSPHCPACRYTGFQFLEIVEFGKISKTNPPKGGAFVFEVFSFDFSFLENIEFRQLSNTIFHRIFFCIEYFIFHFFSY